MDVSQSTPPAPAGKRRAPRYYAIVCSVAGLLVCGLVAALAAVAAEDDASGIAFAVERHKQDYQRPVVVPYPADNGYTQARAALGRALFFDTGLSGSGTMSCATCHQPARSWGDGLPRGRGSQMKPLLRRTPTILDLAWAPALFWDGRADSLEEQALGPIQAPGEMNMQLTEMVRRLDATASYAALFARAYPEEPISPVTVGKAIATFERGVVSAQAPFDRWIAGEPRAISVSAQRGFLLFNERARCSVCHRGWRFTDDGFHDIGVASDDIGRGLLTPNIELTRFAFKTPTLRNIAERAPYLHNGSAATLGAVIDLYDQGGIARRPSLSPEIRPLRLTRGEKSDLLAFLRTLTSRVSNKPFAPSRP